MKNKQLDEIVEQVGQIFKSDPEFDKKQMATNLKLVETLRGLVMAYPSMRFGQILDTFEFVTHGRDSYHDESADILKRVEETLDLFNRKNT